MKILLNKEETNQAVSLSQSTITRMILDNRFPKSIKVGARVLWRAADLEEWAKKLANNEVPEPAKKTRASSVGCIVFFLG